MKFYRVNANKAGDNGWVQCVENDIIWVPVTSKYLKRNEKERCHPFATKGTDRLKCGPGCMETYSVVQMKAIGQCGVSVTVFKTRWIPTVIIKMNALWFYLLFET